MSRQVVTHQVKTKSNQHFQQCGIKLHGRWLTIQTKKNKNKQTIIIIVVMKKSMFC